MGKGASGGCHAVSAPCCLGCVLGALWIFVRDAQVFLVWQAPLVASSFPVSLAWWDGSASWSVSVWLPAYFVLLQFVTLHTFVTSLQIRSKYMAVI